MAEPEEPEEWRPAPGWEAYYDVSSLGRVRRTAPVSNHPGGRILKPDTSLGYPRVRLCAEGRPSYVGLAVLVATAFHPPRPKGAIVRFRDGNNLNCRADNLVWKSAKEACKGPPRAFTEEEAAEVLALRNKVSATKLAAERGVTQLTILKVWNARPPYHRIAAPEPAPPAKVRRVTKRQLASVAAVVEGKPVLVRLLAALEERPQRSRELVATLGYSQPRTTDGLSALRELGAVERTRIGPVIQYSITDLGRAVLTMSRSNAKVNPP